MYNPKEIENIAMLGAYLRTSEEIINTSVFGKSYVVDLNDLSTLKALSQAERDEPRTVFKKFYIPKRNKKLGSRIVYKPQDQFTRDILKVLKYNLDKIYSPLDFVHGFVKNRNTKTNAEVHIGNKFLLNLDIKDFFESISIVKVQRGFLTLGFNDEISNYLSQICTLNNKLVQGLSTSPILANLVCTKMDNEIQTLCSVNNSKYSRYADDISISSETTLPDTKLVEEILNSHGFNLNHLKSKRFKRGQNQYVTGLSISDSIRPRIPKALKKRIRQKLYYINKYGFHSHICHLNEWDESTDISLSDHYYHQTRNILKGWIDYINAIEPDLAKSFYAIFNVIEEKIHKRWREEMEKEAKENNGILLLRHDEGLKPIPKSK